MYRHTKTKDFKKIFLFIIFSFCILSSFFLGSSSFVYADNSAYTNVLDDLQKDETFNVEDYPVVEDDYSLQVIQIAESVDKELFVYVYQPSANSDIVASSITISTSSSEDKTYTIYKLTLLNNFESFYKYKVNNFTVSDNATRYYEITEIFRPWNEAFDSEAENENTISEVSFDVSKQYIFEDNGETINVSCIAVETVTVTDKYVGFVRYEGGYTWDALTYESCDNHFVAFSTDYEIDSLLQAELYYRDRSYRFYHLESMIALTTPTITYGDIEEHHVELSYDEEEEYQGNIFHKKYTWSKISSVEDFIENEVHDDVYHVVFVDVRKQTSLTDEGLDDLKDKQWVLRFATTDYTYKKVGVTQGGVQLTDITTEINSTEVMDVSILRLKFVTEGVTYNLGVIDNMQTGDGEPDNETDTTVEPANWLQALIDFIKSLFTSFGKTVLFILSVILLIVLMPYIVKAVVWILKAAWWLITLPFEIFKK